MYTRWRGCSSRTGRVNPWPGQSSPMISPRTPRTGMGPSLACRRGLGCGSSLRRWGRVGVGASGVSPTNAAGPSPPPSPQRGEGARRPAPTPRTSIAASNATTRPFAKNSAAPPSPACTRATGAPQCQRTPGASACRAVIVATVSMCPSPGSSQACAGPWMAGSNWRSPSMGKAVAAPCPAGHSGERAACARRSSTRCAAPASPRCASSMLPCTDSSGRGSGKAATICRHSSIERQPSAATAGSALSSSAIGLSMPAAVKPAAVGTWPTSGAWLRNTGPAPMAASNTCTACPARASRQASRRPSRPAPAMPMCSDGVMESL